MIIYRHILLLTFIGLFYSCRQKHRGKEQDSPVTKENTSDPCNFEKYLNDRHTPALAKQIFSGKDWDINDNTVLSFFDSIETDNKSRFFYFKVAANSYSKADGYYSEGLGSFGKGFVENNTAEFIRFFDEEKCFTHQDLTHWANIVMLEISLLSSDSMDDSKMRKEAPVLNDYIKKLNLNCKDCSTKQKERLLQFTMALKHAWSDYVKLFIG
jgi:hypothetical protein